MADIIIIGFITLLHKNMTLLELLETLKYSEYFASDNVSKLIYVKISNKKQEPLTDEEIKNLLDQEIVLYKNFSKSNTLFFLGSVTRIVKCLKNISLSDFEQIKSLFLVN